MNAFLQEQHDLGIAIICGDEEPAAVGILSTLPKTLQYDGAALYTSIKYYDDWIKNAMKNFNERGDRKLYKIIRYDDPVLSLVEPSRLRLVVT